MKQVPRHMFQVFFFQAKIHSPKYSKYWDTRLNCNFQRYGLLLPLIRNRILHCFTKPNSNTEVRGCTLGLSPKHTPKVPPKPYLCGQALTQICTACFPFSEVQTQNPPLCFHPLNLEQSVLLLLFSPSSGSYCINSFPLHQSRIRRYKLLQKAYFVSRATTSLT